MLWWTLLLGCPGAPVDSGEEPEPWAELPVRALEPLHPLLEAPLVDASAPTDLVLMSERPLALVRDGEAVRVFDDRYRHDGETWCVDTGNWPEFEVSERQQGDCVEGEVQLSRNTLAPGGVVHGVAVRDTEVLVWAGESLHSASADLLSGSPWDWLRPDEGVALAAPVPVSHSAMAVAPDGTLALAADRWVGLVDGDGTASVSWVLPELVQDLVFSEGSLWAATAGGVWEVALDLVDPVDAARLAPDGAGGVWLAAAGELVHLDASGTRAALDFPGVDGLIARDPVTGRLAVGTGDGLALVEDGRELARVALEGVRDVAVNAHHEVVVLTGDALHVFGDETALGEGDPLALMVGAFLEQPRSPESDLPCTGEDSIDSHLATAAANRAMLDDLPAPIALGVSPHLARRSLNCGRIHDLHARIAGERIAFGVLNHERPDDTCLQEPDCHANFLGGQYEDTAVVGLDPVWFSGLVSHEDGGADWVGTLAALGVVDTYLHYGLAILPDIDQGADPRAKQPYPDTVSGMTATLTGSTLAELFEPTGGPLRLLAGNSLAAFRLSRCPNLMLWECNAISTNEVEPLLRPEDFEVLRVLLFRGLGQRGVGEAWNFHLPDAGSWDYTAGCQVEERRWSGEGCQAALLQDWLFDVHASYVAAGLVSWTGPQDLPWPE